MLDTLLDDMGNLLMMVHAVVENHLEDQLGHGRVLLRFYDPERDLFCTHFADSMPLPRATLGTITMQDTPWLQKVRTMIPRGTVEIDWSYLPTTVKNGKDIIVPRLLLICNSHTGYILKCPLLPPSEDPFEDLMSVLRETIDEYGKPATIEICDDELEDDIADLCQKAKIRLVKKKRLRQTTLARKELLKDYQIIVDDEELN